MEKNYLNSFVPIVIDKDYYIFGAGGQFSGSDDDKFKLTNKQISMLNKLVEGKSFFSDELEEAFGSKLYEYFVKKSIITTIKQDKEGLFSRTDAFYEINKMGNVRRLLSKKRVMILGCGGIGTHVAWNLVTVGVGEIVLVDFDKVEVSNLNRQIMYNIDDIGNLKTIVLEERLRKINPDAKITSLNKMISSKDDLEKICKDYKPDLIIKSLDSPEEFPFFLDEVCKKYGISYVSGSSASTHAVIGPTFIPGKNCGYTEFFSNKDSMYKHISGLSPSLSIIMYDMSGEISIEAFRVLTGTGKIKYSNLMIFKNIITGNLMEITPKSIDVEAEIIRKKQINKNNFIISLVFLLMAIVTDYNVLMWVGAVYACLSSVVVFSVKKNALSAAFINVAWYMLMSIIVSIINNNLLSGIPMVQAISLIVTIFILYSVVLMLACCVVLIVFGVKFSLMRRWGNE
ncbi:ThiF family adenylyltransferase [Clostridium gasigenes]|uniref:HesA/MoeB/ThiF family protein n=1 Tax=Clostridium gasigenes TaxID=94869 RepID=UPI001C0C0B3A|nr:ThiF family adenylyltransferase [Clostridium gasigenes]MBU3089184.1 ThiF family adenylyltransferase [Clostridium gasigenes]